MSNYPVYVIEEDIGTYIHRLTAENDELRKKVARLREALRDVLSDGDRSELDALKARILARAALNSEGAA